MSVRGVLGWTGLTLALALLAPVAVALASLRWLFVRASNIRIRLPSLAEVGQGMIWCGLGLGVLCAVGLGTLYAWHSFFPLPPEVREVYVAPIGQKLPPCIPIKVGSKVKARNHWSIPDGTKGIVIKGVGAENCNGDTSYSIHFEGSEWNWCSKKNTFVPIECSHD